MTCGQASLDHIHEPNRRCTTLWSTTTSSLICKAIEHKQAAVLSFLLANYPDFDLKNGAILGVAFRNPDLDTFQILYTHCPSIVD